MQLPDANMLVAKVDTCAVSRTHFRTLGTPRTYLNATVVDALGKLLVNSSNSRLVGSYFFMGFYGAKQYENTTFSEFLEQQNFDSAMSYLGGRREGVESYRNIWLEKKALYIPIVTEGHWSLLVVDIECKTINHYCSFRTDGTRYCQDMLLILARLYHRDVCDREFERYDWQSWCAEWTWHPNAPCPGQDNGFDCGIFVLLYIQHFSHDVDFPDDDLQTYIANNNVRQRLSLMLLEHGVPATSSNASPPSTFNMAQFVGDRLHQQQQQQDTSVSTAASDWFDNLSAASRAVIEEGLDAIMSSGFDGAVKRRRTDNS